MEWHHRIILELTIIRYLGLSISTYKNDYQYIETVADDS